MNNNDYKILARIIAEEGVRNTYLEDLHAGTTPSNKKKDKSDIKVITPYGEIKWKEVSRISDPEMRELMLDVEKNIKRTLIAMVNAKIISLNIDNEFREAANKRYFGEYGISWDNPQLSKKKKGGEVHVSKSM